MAFDCFSWRTLNWLLHGMDDPRSDHNSRDYKRLPLKKFRIWINCCGDFWWIWLFQWLGLERRWPRGPHITRVTGFEAKGWQLTLCCCWTEGSGVHSGDNSNHLRVLLVNRAWHEVVVTGSLLKQHELHLKEHSCPSFGNLNLHQNIHIQHSSPLTVMPNLRGGGGGGGRPRVWGSQGGGRGVFGIRGLGLGMDKKRMVIEY